MAVDAATMPTIPTSAPATNNSSGSNSSNSNSSSTGIADNFQSFLMLLTTQLQNQNPLDPLDTNQFTQQLVQFAQVEQQLKSNSQLESLVKIEQSAQSTQALVFVGQTVAVDGSTAHFDGNATWNFSAPQNSSATITITNSAGQTAYTGSFAIGSGNSSFVWDGKGNDGTKWPVGDYKMTVTAKDSNGKDVAISTEVQGTVDSVDLTASPALLSIGGKNYTVDQIKRVVKGTASS
ncbi:MAG: flagellar biosynthesis protein FlgD [Afipia sp.]|jgi:flagellar basal-body rod modification protein FlgD|nr:flagellar biosynthesis protein FlgD [Afipia sp.]MBS4005485.1 flagellar biosynthesis protein FlgD [Afipia sp.]WIG52526.1 MAG: Flagellar basal-body rod modification protein FlgD [Afipia sp.]